MGKIEQERTLIDTLALSPSRYIPHHFGSAENLLSHQMWELYTVTMRSKGAKARKVLKIVVSDINQGSFEGYRHGILQLGGYSSPDFTYTLADIKKIDDQESWLEEQLHNFGEGNIPFFLYEGFSDDSKQWNSRAQLFVNDKHIPVLARHFSVTILQAHKRAAFSRLASPFMSPETIDKVYEDFRIKAEAYIPSRKERSHEHPALK